MARKGQLAPGVELQPALKGGGPRCQFVKFPLEGKKWGEQCKKACTIGRPRCKYHGGKAGRPIITGEHSKYHPIPRGLQAKFEKAAEDPEILVLVKDIALLDAQIWGICDDAKEQESFTSLQTKRLLRIMGEKKKLVQQETSRRIALGSMLSAEQAIQLVGYIFVIINQEVKDESAKRRVGARLRLIVGSEASTAIIES